MKRACRVLAAFLVLAALLAGCNKPEVPDQTVTCQDLTLTLPGDYVNLSGEDYAADVEFLYGHGDEAVLGIKQSRSVFMESFPEMSALDFAQLFVDKAGLALEITEQDGFATFLYTANAAGTEVTYLSGVYMTEENFWVVQFYCPSEAFSGRQADFMRFLGSVEA